MVMSVAAAQSAYYWPYLKCTRESELCEMTHFMTGLHAVWGVGGETQGVAPYDSVPPPLGYESCPYVRASFRTATSSGFQTLSRLEFEF